MSFEEYMESKIPGYNTAISEDKINEMKELYSDYITNFNIAKKNIELQYNSTSGIDYSNDFEKFQSLSNVAKSKLDDEIEVIKNELNNEDEKHMSW